MRYCEVIIIGVGVVGMYCSIGQQVISWLPSGSRPRCDPSIKSIMVGFELRIHPHHLRGWSSLNLG